MVIVNSLAHIYQREHTCMDAPEDAVRHSGDSWYGRGSSMGLSLLSKEPLHTTPSSDVQLLAAARRHCHVSAEPIHALDLRVVGDAPSDAAAHERPRY